MSYSGNHYNYQVAVIFAILLGGLLLLALVIGGIYFVCVNNMRDDDRKRLSRSRPQSTVWTPPVQSYPAQTQYSSPPPQQFNNMQQPPQTPIFDQYNPRSVPVSPSVQNYNVSQAPFVTPINNQDFMNVNQYRQLQPETVYTQGPASYVAQTPVEYTISRGEPHNFRTSAI